MGILKDDNKNSIRVNYMNNNGEWKGKSFSINKYGEDEAIRMAESFFNKNNKSESRVCKNEIKIKDGISILEITRFSDDKVYEVYIDNEDINRVKLYQWHVKEDDKDNTCYVRSTNKSKGIDIYLHRYLMNTPEDMQTDHKDRNGLNNMKENLRNVTISVNAKNRGNTKGYYYEPSTNRWTATWNANGNNKRKCFSCNKYGYEEAKILAKEYREKMATEELGYLNKEV